MAVRDRITREDIVLEARRWIGTPFGWQTSIRGRSCDCKGLIVGVARELGMPEAKTLAAGIHNYPHNFSPTQLLNGLEESLILTELPDAGDIIACEIGPVPGPRHLGILTGDGRMIHCYGAGPCQVISAPIGRSRKIHSYWSWPSLRKPNGH